MWKFQDIFSLAVYWSNPRLMKAEGSSGSTCVSKGALYHLWGLKAVFIALLWDLSFVGFKRLSGGALLCLALLTLDLEIRCWHLSVSFPYLWHTGSLLCHRCQDGASYSIQSAFRKQTSSKQKETSMPCSEMSATSSVPFLKLWKCEFGQLKGAVAQLCSITLLGLASLHLFERLTAWFMDKRASVFLPLWALGMGTWRWRFLTWNHLLKRY